MRKKQSTYILIFIVIFLFTLGVVILSNRYIGEGKTYGKPLKWGQIRDNMLVYSLYSVAVAFLGTYSIYQKDKSDK